MTEAKETARLETFCDGVFAIAITLLILGIKIPPVSTVHSTKEFWIKLSEDWPSWFGFALSFCLIFIAWVNHHQVFKLINKTTPMFIYANGFMLLSVVVIPFLTGLMAEYFQKDYAQPAISLYCFATLFHNIGWLLLGRTMLKPVPLTINESCRQKAVYGLRNIKYGFFLYLLVFIISFWFPKIAMCIITVSWLIWIFVGIRIVRWKNT
jgi:uncharacterized membrane protein